MAGLDLRGAHPYSVQTPLSGIRPACAQPTSIVPSRGLQGATRLGYGCLGSPLAHRPPKTIKAGTTYNVTGPDLGVSEWSLGDSNP
jgi:hypothetical protein